MTESVRVAWADPPAVFRCVRRCATGRGGGWGPYEDLRRAIRLVSGDGDRAHRRRSRRNAEHVLSASHRYILFRRACTVEALALVLRRNRPASRPVERVSTWHPARLSVGPGCTSSRLAPPRFCGRPAEARTSRNRGRGWSA